ncbi:MAG: hypothetical protein ACP5QD_01125 [Candidatus Ratteibacteria bacterium]
MNNLISAQTAERDINKTDKKQVQISQSDNLLQPKFRDFGIILVL